MIPNTLQRWIFSALVLLCTAWGCSDSTSPFPPAVITGSVSTSDGSPVEEASILVGYRPSLADLVPPRSQPGFDPLTIGKDGIKGIWVTDGCGDRIRTVCAESCSVTVHWDGRDDQGKKVLDGLYTLWIETRGDSLSEGETLSDSIFIFSEYPDWDPGIYRSPHAVTNTDGTFEFDDRCLGFGATYSVNGEDGTMEYPITRWIDLLAVHPDGRRVWQDSIYVPAGEPVTVDFVFEETAP